MSDELRVLQFDHVVLNVADVERALAFYCGELGLTPVRVEEWRRGEAPFPSARVTGSTLIDLLERTRTGENSDHICLVVEPMDLEALKASGRFEVLDGPATRFGAQGNGTSLYVRDPDGNTVELRYYDA
jgi:catechol 2,3-dioxygenase-like lactoylglutathione lyase family enzyme